MKFLIYFIFFIALLLGFSYLVYLNLSPVEFVLTPEFNGVYYRIPPVPLGFLVVGTFILGFGLGYIFGLFGRYSKK
ncbi:hypothetical protein [Thermocrinis sp.]|uniref:hypothetical protein n=1 Tax=Thermocrinis sp. TaxID=2024383 RepID=UPI002FDEABBF